MLPQLSSEEAAAFGVETVQTPAGSGGNPRALVRSNPPMDARYRPARRTCPHCGESVLRIHRRVIDRLYSLYHPVYRYQCTSLECGWQGNLPQRPHLDQAGIAPLTTPTGTP